MREERTVLIEGQKQTLLISDDYQALLAAKAAGRAVLGVETPEQGSWSMQGIPYVVYAQEDVTDELAELILRRHLGLPWEITRTSRLIIRELAAADAAHIPAEEYPEEERIFRSPELLALYAEKQYGFYEYGIWGVVEKESGLLVGLAGVMDARLTENMEKHMPALLEHQIWLELGYHIFKPYRCRGFALEAAGAVISYAHEVLSARLCALIPADNQTSRHVAEGLGMCLFMEEGQRDSGWCEELLLYGENCPQLPDKADS